MSHERGTILVGTDFDPASDEAIRQGLRWAADCGWRLAVCHVLPEIVGSNPLFPERAIYQQDTILELQRKVLLQIEQQVGRCTNLEPHQFESRVEIGVPASTLVRLGHAEDVHGLVVGGEARSSNAFFTLGTTAERIVRYATESVLLARKSPHSGHVLAATDLSDPGIPVLHAAAREARARSARLTLLHCVELPMQVLIDGSMGMALPVVSEEQRLQQQETALARLRAAAEREGVEAEILCETGLAIETILHTAQERQSELIVMGSHGRTGMGRFMLGSVAESVLRQAQTSVKVVRLAE